MSGTNFEIKARCDDHDRIRKMLIELKADFKGIDHQIDTYFHSETGMLKLREGNIENTLIHYVREKKAGPKRAEILLFENNPSSSLKNILLRALKVRIVVDKKREIYFIDNVKFHLDEVKGLGKFLEVEAISMENKIPIEKIKNQCQYYLDLFEIKNSDLVKNSYSEMLEKL
jgi:adenylate cyclase class 2